MLIKKNRQLKVDDIIKWNVKPITLLSNPNIKKADNVKLRTVELKVRNVYPHFVEFTIMEEPFLPVSITNNELYQNGIYKSTDFVIPFVRA